MADKKKSYKDLERELGELLDRIERAEYDDLDQMLADHKAANSLIDKLQTKLTDAQNTIRKVAKG